MRLEIDGGLIGEKCLKFIKMRTEEGEREVNKK
jgi:hypothetical protein